MPRWFISSNGPAPPPQAHTGAHVRVLDGADALVDEREAT
jgi:hypothetical protein